MSSDPYLTGTVLSVQPLADLFGVGLVAAHDPDAVLASSVVPGSPIAGPRLDGLEPTCVLRDAITRHWLKAALSDGLRGVGRAVAGEVPSGDCRPACWSPTASSRAL